MATDLFEQLAETLVPPAPPQWVFDRLLHQRINNRLLVAQVIDLGLRGFGFAVVHFARAVVGMIRFTLTGKFAEERRNGGPRKNGR